MKQLQLYGWNEKLFRQKQNSIYKDFLHGRVTVTHESCYEVVSEVGQAYWHRQSLRQSAN